jgi:hypothetical protein
MELRGDARSRARAFRALRSIVHEKSEDERFRQKCVLQIATRSTSFEEVEHLLELLRDFKAGSENSLWHTIVSALQASRPYSEVADAFDEIKNGIDKGSRPINAVSAHDVLAPAAKNIREKIRLSGSPR